MGSQIFEAWGPFELCDAITVLSYKRSMYEDERELPFDEFNFSDGILRQKGSYSG